MKKPSISTWEIPLKPMFLQLPMGRCCREPRYISGHASVASASVAWEVAKMATRAARPGDLSGKTARSMGKFNEFEPETGIFRENFNEFEPETGIFKRISMNFSQKLGFSREFQWIWARNWDFQGVSMGEFRWILARNWDLVVSMGHFW